LQKLKKKRIETLEGQLSKFEEEKELQLEIDRLKKP
jgi:hypothetical protein